MVVSKRGNSSHLSLTTTVRKSFRYLLSFQFLSFSSTFRQNHCQVINFCSKLRGWRPFPVWELLVTPLQSWKCCQFCNEVAKSKIISVTKMHASRMRTARSSSRLLGGLPQCMLGYTPSGPGPGPPSPGVGLHTPPQARPPQPPPGCGPRQPPPREQNDRLA